MDEKIVTEVEEYTMHLYRELNKENVRNKNSNQHVNYDVKVIDSYSTVIDYPFFRSYHNRIYKGILDKSLEMRFIIPNDIQPLFTVELRGKKVNIVFHRNGLRTKVQKLTKDFQEEKRNLNIGKQ